jgi:hypothetical protein
MVNFIKFIIQQKKRKLIVVVVATAKEAAFVRGRKQTINFRST